MKVIDIAQILNAEILCCSDLAQTAEVSSAFGADMMSDVLAYVTNQGMLLTGLLNPHVVRTAEMWDITCIIFVRGKNPDKSVIVLAESKNIILLSTPDRMYPACGKLYGAGVKEG